VNVELDPVYAMVIVILPSVESTTYFRLCDQLVLAEVTTGFAPAKAVLSYHTLNWRAVIFVVVVFA
jgi:hypothetical protein